MTMSFRYSPIVLRRLVTAAFVVAVLVPPAVNAQGGSVDQYLERVPEADGGRPAGDSGGGGGDAGGNEGGTGASQGGTNSSPAGAAPGGSGEATASGGDGQRGGDPAREGEPSHEEGSDALSTAGGADVPGELAASTPDDADSESTGGSPILIGLALTTLMFLAGFTWWIRRGGPGRTLRKPGEPAA
jgi:hypothetical protein